MSRLRRWAKRLGAGKARRRLRTALWLRGLATEWQYRLRRPAVKRRLQQAAEVPRGLHLEATNICNARCIFCAYPQMERPKVSMDMDLFQRVLDQYEAMGGRHVSLTPIVGDPFVDRLLFERLDVLAARLSIQSFYFFTNAILMTPETVERLLSYGSRLRICVSMGGFDRETYDRLMGVDRFAKVWGHLREYVERSRAYADRPRLEIHLRCAETDCRGEAWLELKGWEKEGLAQIFAIETYDSWAGKIDAHDLEKHGLRATRQVHRRGACELLYMKPVVLADGRVNACACRDVEAELIVGDLEQNSLGEIFDGEPLQDLRRRHEAGDYPEVCRRCTYYVSVYDPLMGQVSKDALNWRDG